jgi:hypothetical protein
VGEAAGLGGLKSLSTEEFFPKLWGGAALSERKENLSARRRLGAVVPWGTNVLPLAALGFFPL